MRCARGSQSRQQLNIQAGVGSQPTERHKPRTCHLEAEVWEKKAPKCQRQMKGAGKFNLPTFPTNVTFGFHSDKPSAGELFPSFSLLTPTFWLVI